MSFVPQSLSPTSATSNTFSVLSAMTPTVQKPLVQSQQVTPLTNTQFASARGTGFINPNDSIVSSTSPLSVTQTVNSPQIIPVRPASVPIPKFSPSITTNSAMMAGVPGGGDFASANIGIVPGGMGFVPNVINIGPGVMNPSTPVANYVNTTSPVLNIPMLQSPPSPMVVSQLNVPQPQLSPNARSALLNIAASNKASGMQGSSVMIPNMIPVPSGSQQRIGATQENILFSRTNVPNSGFPLKPTAELMNQSFEIRNYQGIISNSSLENELLNGGYAPLSKIVVRAENGENRTQYIKAVNKKGQKVFILVDVNGYTTARSTDLTLIEANKASIVPYSVKTGAYNCASKDVCGVAFECGSDAVCVLSRNSQDLTPKEANFVFIEQPSTAVGGIDKEGSIMAYPVIRLSEIRANPNLVLTNTDIVTRRLRNSSYINELGNLSGIQASIQSLNSTFARFNEVRENVAGKLNTTLTQLERYNDVYMMNPPQTDEAKDKYRKLQYNLANRNDGIADLLRVMKRVVDMRAAINAIVEELHNITEYTVKEFANVEFANSD